MEVSLSRAEVKDATTIHEMQTQAFLPLLEKYLDHDTNPANETLERTLERMNQPLADNYIIWNSKVAVGAIRVMKKDNSAYRVGRIFVMTEH